MARPDLYLSDVIKATPHKIQGVLFYHDGFSFIARGTPTGLIIEALSDDGYAEARIETRNHSKTRYIASISKGEDLADSDMSWHETLEGAMRQVCATMVEPPYLVENFN